MVSGPMACVKYLLCCFNFLFVLSGIIIITAGYLIEAAYYRYDDFMDSNLSKPPLILIWTGIVILVISFCGFCGAVRENRCLINTFAVLLLVVFLFELGAGISGYMHKNEVQSMLQRKFNESMIEYPTKPEIRGSWDTLQTDLKCCGTNGPNDWVVILHNETLPNSCCPNNDKNIPCTTYYPQVQTKGCLPLLQELLLANADKIGAVGIGIALSQLIGVVCAFTLARKIGSEYETV